MAQFSENELIEKFFVPLSGEGAFNLRDDAALLQPKPGEDLVVTTDTLVSGVHFFENAKAGEVAAKALRVNLSDLAAKGAAPLGYLLALSMPADTTAAWLKSFSTQLRKDQKEYGITLLGGDTTRSSLLTVTVTAFGSVPKGKMLKRSGAKPGDLVAVTGTIGDAALALKVLKGEIKDEKPNALIKRYHYPQPRIKLSKLLREQASAAMDISDGFVGDLQKLCSASRVSAKIALEKIPHSPGVLALIKKNEILREAALTGGDDYEVLFTIAANKWPSFEKKARHLAVSVTRVGEIVKGTSAPLFSYKKELRFFPRGSYQHF